MGNQEQPPPENNDHEPVWEAVVRDIRERDQIGRSRYGTPLQPFNGRRPLVDLYQELLDAVVYTKQRLLEEEEMYSLAGVQEVTAGSYYSADDDTWRIELDRYERNNLLWLLNACGYGRDGIEPFMYANTGDWLGQVAQKLALPNRAPVLTEQQEDRANRLFAELGKCIEHWIQSKARADRCAGCGSELVALKALCKDCR